MHCQETACTSDQHLEGLRDEYKAISSFAGLPLVVPQFEVMKKAGQSIAKKAIARRKEKTRSVEAASVRSVEKITKEEAIKRTQELLHEGTLYSD